MTPEEAKDLLKKIYMQRADDEAAHCLEDQSREVFYGRLPMVTTAAFMRR